MTFPRSKARELLPCPKCGTDCHQRWFAGSFWAPGGWAPAKPEPHVSPCGAPCVYGRLSLVDALLSKECHGSSLYPCQSCNGEVSGERARRWRILIHEAKHAQDTAGVPATVYLDDASMDDLSRWLDEAGLELYGRACPNRLQVAGVEFRRALLSPGPNCIVLDLETS